MIAMCEKYSRSILGRGYFKEGQLSTFMFSVSISNHACSAIFKFVAKQLPEEFVYCIWSPIDQDFILLRSSVTMTGKR